jgi:hypothetical protein
MGLGDHNMCRNPDGADTIWCYTTDPKKRWEYCDPIKNAVTAKGRYLDIVGNNVVIKTPNSFDSQTWFFDYKTRTIKS